VPRRLGKDDYVYRVIDPEHRDDNGPLAIAFQDPGTEYESLSFFVATVATPCSALSALARFDRAKSFCNTGNSELSPDQMYDVGYRVARIPASFILAAIEATSMNEKPISIKKHKNDDCNNKGHLNLLNGRFYVQILAKDSGLVVLNREETLGINV
jgi:hypothetical protein